MPSISQNKNMFAWYIANQACIILMYFFVVINVLYHNSLIRYDGKNLVGFVKLAFICLIPSSYFVAYKKVLIRINSVDIEEPWDTLAVNHSSPSLSEPYFAYVRGGVRAFVFPEGITTITFCSDNMVQYSGFHIEAFTTDVNGEKGNWGKIQLFENKFICYRLLWALYSILANKSLSSWPNYWNSNLAWLCG